MMNRRIILLSETTKAKQSTNTDRKSICTSPNIPEMDRLIRMFVLGQIHNVPINVQIRQLGPWVLGPRVDEPPYYRQNEHAD